MKSFFHSFDLATQIKVANEAGNLRDRDDSTLTWELAFQRWLDLSRLTDIEYGKWLYELFRHCANYAASMPTRPVGEAMNVGDSNFSIRYLDDQYKHEIAPSTDFRSPPAGYAYSRSPDHSSTTIPTTASPRGVNDPNLVWTVRNSPTYDQQVDAIWDENH